jgi:uncharacterized repeat protein (TIGR02543 family)
MKKLTVLVVIAALIMGCSNPSGGEPGSGPITVSFNSNGGSTVGDLTIPQGGTVTQPMDPVPADPAIQVFGGWYRESTFANPWGFGADAVTGNVTLYAKWLTQDQASAEDFGGATAETPITVTDTAGWESALSGISGGKNYVIIVNSDITVNPESFTGSNTKVSLRGAGSLTLGSNGSLVTVGADQTLILRGPALKGKNDYTTKCVVTVDGTGAEFIMKGGSISGNSNYNYGGHGVYVNSGTFTLNGGTNPGFVDSRDTITMNGGTITGDTDTALTASGGVSSSGTFTMNGGTITGNTSSTGPMFISGAFTMNNGTISGNTATSGGGVYIGRAVFIMNNGTISGNTATNECGGVVVNRGDFTMKGGSISGNTTTGISGGVGVSMEAAFTMSGGTIGGNTAGSYGGGVYVSIRDSGTPGTFTKTGGTVYGSDAGANRNRAGGDGKGHAVVKTNSNYTLVKYRDTTAGPSVNINTSDDTGLY